MESIYKKEGFISGKRRVEEDRMIPAYEIVDAETKLERRDDEPQIDIFKKMFTPEQFQYLKTLPEYEDRIYSNCKDKSGKVWVSVKTAVKIFPAENDSYWSRYIKSRKNTHDSFVEFDLNYFFKTDSRELRRMFFKFKEFLDKEIKFNNKN